MPVPRCGFRHPAPLRYAAYLTLVEGVVDGDTERFVIPYVGRRLVRLGADSLIRPPVHEMELSPYVLQEGPALDMKDQNIGRLFPVFPRHRMVERRSWDMMPAEDMGQ